jgi:hypothetical protein
VDALSAQTIANSVTRGRLLVLQSRGRRYALMAEFQALLIPGGSAASAARSPKGDATPTDESFFILLARVQGKSKECRPPRCLRKQPPP